MRLIQRRDDRLGDEGGEENGCAIVSSFNGNASVVVKGPSARPSYHSEAFHVPRTTQRRELSGLGCGPRASTTSRMRPNVYARTVSLKPLQSATAYGFKARRYTAEVVDVAEKCSPLDYQSSPLTHSRWF